MIVVIDPVVPAVLHGMGNCIYAAICNWLYHTQHNRQASALICPCLYTTLKANTKTFICLAA